VKGPAVTGTDTVGVLSGTVTEAGTVTAAVLEPNVIVTPVDCAVAERAAVQLVPIFGERVDTPHVKDEIAGKDVNEIDVWAVVLLYVAVIVALRIDEMAPVLTVNEPDVAPEAMVTEVGIVSARTLDVNVTTAPPDGAAWFSLIEQVVLAFCAMLETTH